MTEAAATVTGAVPDPSLREMANLTTDPLDPKAAVTSRIELYIVMGMLTFLSIMGTAGNALVLYVFSQKKDKLVSTLFIIVLAFVDFITCLIVIPYTIYMEYVNYAVDYDVVCKTYQFLITSNIPFSAMIMVAIAVDRYFCICHPFLHALNLQRAKIVIAVLAFLAIMLGVCVALMYGVYETTMIPVLRVNESHWVTDVVSSNLTDGEYVDLWTSSDFMKVSGDDSTTTNDSSSIQHANATIIHFTGSCDPNEIVISAQFIWYYQKFYTALYLVCLITVIVLYVLIYKSVLARRTKRQKQKSKSLPLVQMSSERTADNATEDTLLAAEPLGTANGDTEVIVEVKNGSTTSREKTAAQKAKELKEREKQKRKSMKKDRNRMANLKTAAMLFVVTVVFIVTFCPAFLMANMIIPNNMTVFYMYFANNVANPVIYSFMNKNFRDDLKKLFCTIR